MLFSGAVLPLIGHYHLLLDSSIPSSRYFVASFFCAILCASVPCNIHSVAGVVCPVAGAYYPVARVMYTVLGEIYSFAGVIHTVDGVVCPLAGVIYKVLGEIHSVTRVSGGGGGGSLCSRSVCHIISDLSTVRLPSCWNSGRPIFDEWDSVLSGRHNQSHSSSHTSHGLCACNPCSCMENSALQVPVDVYVYKYRSEQEVFVYHNSIQYMKRGPHLATVWPFM